MLEGLQHATFAGLIGQVFTLVANEDQALTVLLTEATLARPGNAGPRAEPFSLIFRGPRQPVLPQKIYALRQEAIGTIDLFLVPIGPDREGMRYQAVFN